MSIKDSIMNLEPGICSKCKKHTAVGLSPSDEFLCKDFYPVGSSHLEANTCEDCIIKEGNVKLQLNELYVGEDLCQLNTSLIEAQY